MADAAAGLTAAEVLAALERRPQLRRAARVDQSTLLRIVAAFPTVAAASNGYDGRVRNAAVVAELGLSKRTVQRARRLLRELVDGQQGLLPENRPLCTGRGLGEAAPVAGEETPVGNARDVDATGVATASHDRGRNARSPAITGSNSRCTEGHGHDTAPRRAGAPSGGGRA